MPAGEEDDGVARLQERAVRLKEMGEHARRRRDLGRRPHQLGDLGRIHHERAFFPKRLRDLVEERIVVRCVAPHGAGDVEPPRFVLRAFDVFQEFLHLAVSFHSESVADAEPPEVPLRVHLLDVCRDRLLDHVLAALGHLVGVANPEVVPAVLSGDLDVADLQPRLVRRDREAVCYLPRGGRLLRPLRAGRAKEQHLAALEAPEAGAVNRPGETREDLLVRGRDSRARQGVRLGEVEDRHRDVHAVHVPLVVHLYRPREVGCAVRVLAVRLDRLVEVLGAASRVEGEHGRVLVSAAVVVRLFAVLVNLVDGLDLPGAAVYALDNLD